MKKNTVKMLFIAFAAVGSISAYAQTPEQRKQIIKDNNLEELAKIEKESREYLTKNYAEALELAKVKGWALKKTNERGEKQELVGVMEDGSPIYATESNVGAAITIRANKLRPGGGMGLNYTGQGMRAAIWDGGLARGTHDNFDGRVEYGDVADIEDHATHVTGTVLGGGLGNPAAKGIAYQASGISYDWSLDIPEMTAEAAGGLLVSNHSYSFSPNPMPIWFYGAYASYAKQLDDVTFNAPRYQPVIAAGNDRNSTPQNNPDKFGYDLIYCYATAKNAVVVAAVANVPNYTGINSVSIASFSSWGPTDDNRIKPDICAKGLAVFSSFAGSDSDYGTSQGTSMAAPGITGAIVLLQQHYNTLNGAFMWSSTVRGLIAHCADEAGDFDGPDPGYGWGLMNTQRAAQAIIDNGTMAIVEEKQLTQGQTYTRNVTANSDGKIIATISWTDRSGTANSGTTDLSTPVLRNNLDIRVTKVGSGEVYMPWKFGDFMSDAPIKGDNNVDNIEKIEIEGASGEYQITVTHKGTLVSGAQNYSLIVTGVDETLAVDDIASQIFNVWPNPAHGQLNISLPAGAENNASVKLYDIQGRVMQQNRLSGVDNTINVDNLSSGIYIVSVTNGNKTESKKVVIK